MKDSNVEWSIIGHFTQDKLGSKRPLMGYKRGKWVGVYDSCGGGKI